MSKRVEQISEVILHELNQFIIRELEPPQDVLITITKIKTSDDLHHALIFVSILPVNKTGTAIVFLNKHLSRMRHYLNQKIRLYRLPDLKLVVDDSALKTRSIEREIEKSKPSSAGS